MSVYDQASLHQVSDRLLRGRGFDDPEVRVLLGVALLDLRDPELLAALLGTELDRVIQGGNGRTRVDCLSAILFQHALFGTETLHYQMTDEARAALQLWYWEHQPRQAAELAEVGIEHMRERIIDANKRSRAIRYFQRALALVNQVYLRDCSAERIANLTHVFLKRPDTRSEHVHTILRGGEPFDEGFTREVRLRMSQMPKTFLSEDSSVILPGNTLSPGEDLMDDLCGDHNKSARRAVVAAALFDFGLADPEGFLLGRIMSLIPRHISVTLHNQLGISDADDPCRIKDPNLRASLQEHVFSTSPLHAFTWGFFAFPLIAATLLIEDLSSNQRNLLLQRTLAMTERLWFQAGRTKGVEHIKRPDVIEQVVLLTGLTQLLSALDTYEGDEAFVSAIRAALPPH